MYTMSYTLHTSFRNSTKGNYFAEGDHWKGEESQGRRIGHKHEQNTMICIHGNVLEKPIILYAY